MGLTSRYHRGHFGCITSVIRSLEPKQNWKQQNLPVSHALVSAWLVQLVTPVHYRNHWEPPTWSVIRQNSNSKSFLVLVNLGPVVVADIIRFILSEILFLGNRFKHAEVFHSQGEEHKLKEILMMIADKTESRFIHLWFDKINIWFSLWKFSMSFLALESPPLKPQRERNVSETHGDEWEIRHSFVLC